MQEETATVSNVEEPVHIPVVPAAKIQIVTITVIVTPSGGTPESPSSVEISIKGCLEGR